MATRSSIEWTQTTWNPCLGCRKVSSGCRKCYAERMANRIAGMARKLGANAGRAGHYVNVVNAQGHWNNRIDLVPESLRDPLRWKKPQMVFVNSMSDLFHEDVPVDFILQVFEVMNRCPQHTFQVLTKRSGCPKKLSPELPWTPNIWMGVSIENPDYTFRIDDLRDTCAAVKFLSLEPLLAPLPDLNLSRIDWVIVGGESGPGARPMAPAWAGDIRDQCRRSGVPFFFKQWGQIRNNPDPTDPTAKQNGGTAKGGRLLNGRTWDEMPNRSNEADKRTGG